MDDLGHTVLALVKLRTAVAHALGHVSDAHDRAALRALYEQHARVCSRQPRAAAGRLCGRGLTALSSAPLASPR